MSGLIAVRSVLLNGQVGPEANNQTSPQVKADGTTTGVPASPLYFPRIRARAARETVYKILVQSVQGAPTTGTITFKFQAGMATTHGETTPPVPSTFAAGYTDANPRWQTLEATEYPDILPDGPFPAEVANQASTDVMILRRIKGGFDHRLFATFSFTGGTNPGFLLTVETEVRY